MQGWLLPLISLHQITFLQRFLGLKRALPGTLKNSPNWRGVINEPKTHQKHVPHGLLRKDHSSLSSLVKWAKRNNFWNEANKPCPPGLCAYMGQQGRPARGAASGWQMNGICKWKAGRASWTEHGSTIHNWIWSICIIHIHVQNKSTCIAATMYMRCLYQSCSRHATWSPKNSL